MKQLAVQYGGRRLDPITISIGVSCYPTHGSAITELIEAADRALYQAKAEGRDRVIKATSSGPKADASEPAVVA